MMSEENSNHDNGKTSLVQTIFRISLGLILLFTGIGHLTFLQVEFLAQVPTWLPLNGDLVVVLSGIVELILGTALIFLSRHRIIVGWVVTAFFVLISCN